MRRTRFVVFGLTLLALAFSVPVQAPIAAQTGTPAATGSTPCAPTTLEQNKEIVRRYWAEVWRAGGDAAVDDLLAADEVHHWGFGDDTVGTDAFAERLRGFLAAFPDLRIEPERLIAEGDQVVSRWIASGTHEGDFFGIAPTGRQVTWTGIQIFRIECGRIAESWGQGDHLGLRQQLGADIALATPTSGS